MNNAYIFLIIESGLSAPAILYRFKNTLKRISRDISVISGEQEIRDADKITHYQARHTYAIALKRSGIPIAVISEALGHSSESTTKAYLEKFEQTEIDNTFPFLL